MRHRARFRRGTGGHRPSDQLAVRFHGNHDTTQTAKSWRGRNTLPGLPHLAQRAAPARSAPGSGKQPDHLTQVLSMLTLDMRIRTRRRRGRSSGRRRDRHFGAEGRQRQAAPVAVALDTGARGTVACARLATAQRPKHYVSVARRRAESGTENGVYRAETETLQGTEPSQACSKHAGFTSEHHRVPAMRQSDGNAPRVQRVRPLPRTSGAGRGRSGVAVP